MNMENSSEQFLRLAFSRPGNSLDFMQKRIDNGTMLWNRVNEQDKELFDDFHPFGYAFFSNQILFKPNMIFFTKNITDILESENWSIAVNSIDESVMWQKRLSMIKECQAIFLDVKIGSETYISYVFKCLEPIGFPDLLMLDLYSCRISNIQLLANIDAPKLNRISLIYNNIYTFKSLGKCHFALNNLYLISTSLGQSIACNRHLNRNQAHYHKALDTIRPYAILDNFSRWNFPLVDLRLEKHSYNTVGMQDLSFLAKSKPAQKSSEFKINVARQKRIRQQSVIEILKKTKMEFDIFIPDGQDFPQADVGLYRWR